MKMRARGRTGIQVGPHCLGTMTGGQAGDPDRGGGPPEMGLRTGRYRKGRPEPRNARMKWVPRLLTDERAAA
ncbi:hypothetical protein IMZ11_07445 [Microtetraspora sp. AC03309]|uniref:hypothetical protein n=1 Tax=Microtetraspora sp. AC03309 TaxID=2779376 RepID=UPI001E44D35B|nr:hypothetical protein [Microtetraspora sp. AC03309]MCC5575475.1 hypothetical protein [Microtetraspora sp. AC03309]